MARSLVALLATLGVARLALVGIVDHALCTTVQTRQSAEPEQVLALATARDQIAARLLEAFVGAAPS